MPLAEDRFNPDSGMYEFKVTMADGEQDAPDTVVDEVQLVVDEDIVELEMGEEIELLPGWTSVNMVFCVDLTGSMNIPQLISIMLTTIEKLRDSGYPFKLGITSFADFPIAPWGGIDDFAYRKDLDLTEDYDAALTTASNLRDDYWGNDAPESQLHAILHTTNDISWEPSDKVIKVILLISDTTFHNPEPGTIVYTEGYPGPPFSSVVSNCLAKDVRVYGWLIDEGGGFSDYAAISSATDGLAFHGSSIQEVVDAMIALMRQSNVEE